MSNDWLGTSTAEPQLQPLAVGQTEAARLLNLSVRTIRVLSKSGELKCARIGRARRYAVTDLAEFLRQRSENSAAAAPAADSLTARAATAAE